jgi:hypothetical protein
MAFATAFLHYLLAISITVVAAATDAKVMLLLL